MAYRLNGIDASNPQGWMAAIGVVYILDRMEKDVWMHWDGRLPVLEGIDPSKVIGTLLEYKAKSDLLDNLPTTRGAEKGSLDFTGGTVILSKVIRQMLDSVDHEVLVEALDHPWKNKDNIANLGWDVNAIKLAATLPGEKNPSQANHKGVIAAQWLAAESLPLTSPVYPVRNRAFIWTTWSISLDLQGIRSILFSESVDWGGVKYKSQARPNGNLNYFEPSVLVDQCEPLVAT